MADEAQAIRSINWREVFPFTHLFRAFRIAVHPSKLLLALAALLLIYTGGRVMDWSWRRLPDRHLATVEEFPSLSNMKAAPGDDTQRALGPYMAFFRYEVEHVNSIAHSVLSNNWFSGPGAARAALTGVEHPTYGVFPSLWRFLVVGPGNLLYFHPVFGIIFFAWFLLIWSLFGGAISRIAAVHVARDEKISVRQALRFSINKVLSFLFAPLIPLLIILVIGAIVSGTGAILLRIPVAGPILTGILFFLALLAGFIMTLVALGTIGGFNLMFPTVAVEGSDSFDAISRSFSYVFARPWRMLFYTVVALAYGALTYLFVRLFIFIMLAMTHFFVGWWLGKGAAGRTWKGLGDQPPMWPAPRWRELPYDVNYSRLEWSEDVGAGAISFWVYITIALLGAFAISFYFSANTIIYCLMRREVDATELDDVYVEETEDEFGEPAPVTTTAAHEAALPAAGGAMSEGGAGARAYGDSGGATSTSSTGGTTTGGAVPPP